MNLESMVEPLQDALAGSGFPGLPVLFAALALLFWVLRPADRATLRHTAQLYALALAGQAATVLAGAAGTSVAGDVLHELAVILAGVALIRLGGLLLFRLLLPALRMATPRILEDVLVIVGYAAWGLIRLRYAGLDASQIVTTSAVITAVVAFSMQDTLGNILGGLAIQLDDSLRVGDWIRVDDISGRVTDIRWRSVLLETNNWETVVIPNAQLMKSRFTVLAQRGGRPAPARRWIGFDVDYSAPPSKVVAAALDALQRSPIAHLAPEPPPQCLLVALEAGRARYALRYWLDDLTRDESTDAEVRQHLLAGLQRAGLAIAAPQYSVRVLKESAKQHEAEYQREIGRRLQTLRGLDIFAHLQPEELRRIAERLVDAPFAPGEVMTRQGAEAHWLYLLAEGEAQVVFEDAAGRHPVSRLHAGTVFGERGMMLGERRSSTVTALGEVRCYRLDRAAFEDIIRSRPQMAEDISRILAARDMELQTLREALDAEAHAHELERRHGEILYRIREFFSLG
jgi:small-conductance mechanosensitive channel/CRP-like cAMP-binding protein